MSFLFVLVSWLLFMIMTPQTTNMTFKVLFVNAKQQHQPSSSSSSSSFSAVNDIRNVRSSGSNSNINGRIVIVGSMNLDSFLPVDRLPIMGENIAVLHNDNDDVNNTDIMFDIPGGKGCTQAIATSKLYPHVAFVSQFSSYDHGGQIMYNLLCPKNITTNNYMINPIEIIGYNDNRISKRHNNIPSGRGYVMIQPKSGEVCAIIYGGTNIDGWKDIWENAYNEYNQTQQFNNEIKIILEEIITGINHKQKQQQQKDDIDNNNNNNNNTNNNKMAVAIMLQCEIPNYVNELIALYCKQYYPNIIIVLDIGGIDRIISNQLLKCCHYIVPNESELKRLMKYYTTNTTSSSNSRELTTIDMIEILQQNGANHILITQGSNGSTLFYRKNTNTIILYESTCCLLSSVLDETGAGDCYRAAFITKLIEYKQQIQKQQVFQDDNEDNNDYTITMLQHCMEYASAAGACSVEKKGAIPSTPSRQDIEDRMKYNQVYKQKKLKHQQEMDMQEQEEGGVTEEQEEVQKEAQQKESMSSLSSKDENDNKEHESSLKPFSSWFSRNKRHHPMNNIDGDNDDDFTFEIGSRLNSMKDRPDLWNHPLYNTSDYVKRQSYITGLTCIDFNYPQHFINGLEDSNNVKRLLDQYHLIAGAICIRFPSPKYTNGAMNHYNETIRNDAIQLICNAAQMAIELNCTEVVIWSAYDGYDYPFQVNYNNHWDQLVYGFQKCCDMYPNIKFSLEYKPTDENTRFFTVPSTGAACLLTIQVNRTNFGLTLDVGHMLMSGENPGQSIAMVGRILDGKRLFGIQLNDGYTRLAAEDGLMFGSVHPNMALEIMYQIRQIDFNGHFYFDTFAQRTDPIKEAEYNIKRVKAFWKASGYMNQYQLKQIMNQHDAIGALEMVNDLLRRM